MRPAHVITCVCSCLMQLTRLKQEKKAALDESFQISGQRSFKQAGLIAYACKRQWHYAEAGLQHMVHVL